MVPAGTDAAPTREETRAQVDRVLKSGGFAGAELLRSLLAFLADRSFDHPGQAAKEFEIATTVFGRGADFDARLDSVVRVQTGRLRAKLAEYYMGEGEDDPVIVEIPKGAYMLARHYRHARPALPAEAAAPAASPGVWSGWRAWGGWALASALACCWLAVWISSRPAAPPRALAAFWRGFTAEERPIVVFTNPRFAGTAVTGLRYFRDSADPQDLLNVTYTGTGDVMSVFELTRLFAHFGQTFDLKRSNLLTWDEARHRNLIFIGSPEQNSSVRELPRLREFQFKPGIAEPHYGVGGVLNLKPRAGEKDIYLNSGPPYTSDYGVVAHVPGLRAGRRALILAGTVTYGTEGLVEHLCREDFVADLLRRLEVAPGGPLPYFEALFHARISGGVPVETRIEIVRARK